ncbi:MAG TPA: alpha-hydroxy acid oxidase [Gemmatimonadales bacterium]|nr:alpha-hydroxy acid oxidase [Gemmatimonadales bacterium]
MTSSKGSLPPDNVARSVSDLRILEEPDAELTLPASEETNLSDLEHRAREILARPVYDFVSGGADDEVTLRDNEAAWTRIRLRPHVLQGVDRVSTRTTLLGTPLGAPIIVAPFSYQRLIHAEGEVATARGGAAAESLLVISTRATVSLEEIASAAPNLPRWFQVYILRDRGWTAELVLRAAASGCRALMLTVDAPVIGRNHRAERSRFSFPQSQLANLGSGVPVDPTELQSYSGAEHDPAIGLDDIGWLRQVANLPVIVKGVLRGDDAAACVEAGADAVVVSNHGGRQLDTSIATADALPDVAESVGSRAQVYVDGGIRRGTDILKALALGADAVLVGRPAIWGLAVAGAEGVFAVLDTLRQELVRAMMLCQTSTLQSISSDLLVLDNRAHPPSRTAVPRSL